MNISLAMGLLGSVILLKMSETFFDIPLEKTIFRIFLGNVAAGCSLVISLELEKWSKRFFQRSPFRGNARMWLLCVVFYSLPFWILDPSFRSVDQWFYLGLPLLFSSAWALPFFGWFQDWRSRLSVQR